MEVQDSRRLTGPNIIWHLPGAVLDIRLDGDDGDPDLIVEQWQRQARRILLAVGWSEEKLAHRRFHSGLSLALSAPIDALYAATEVNEWAWQAARQVLGGGEEPPLDAASSLADVIAREQNPSLLALRRAAHRHGVAFLWDDDRVSIGMGTGSLTFPVDKIPHPADVDWDQVHDIPVALITGTNGKTTTVRLVRSMVAAASKAPGLSSTDGCWVEGEEIGEGDFSGPGGARLVLRDHRVEIGLLETARGGLLRRGLGVERADVAVITNVAEDHLGEWGIHDLEELAATKWIITRGAENLVLNWDDPLLRAAAETCVQPVVFFSLDPAALDQVPTEIPIYGLSGGSLIRRTPTSFEELLPIAEIPLALGGAARHNVANALAACAVADGLGIPSFSIREGLRSFGSSPTENPGRLNRFDLGGVTAIVDFAHNPHGLAALLEVASTLPATRRAILVGQAGDRGDEDIRELPRLVWKSRPDLVILKELPEHLRGRELGEVTSIMAEELRKLGASEDQLRQARSEREAAVEALRWAQEGDLLLLITHEERDYVLTLLQELAASGWKPGQALPG